MRSDLSEESHVPLHPIWVILLDLRVKHLDDIIHHLTSDLVTPVAGTSTARVLVGLLEDLKGSKPVQTDHFCAYILRSWASVVDDGGRQCALT